MQRSRSLQRLVTSGLVGILLPPTVALSWLVLRGTPADTSERAILAIALLVSLVIGLAIAHAVNRAMRQLDEGLRQLGAGEFERPIQFDGPRELEVIGARLDRLRRRLAQLEDQKLDFVRHISHELKTPLTAIREGAELLLDHRDPPLDAETLEIAEIMRDSAVALEKLITDLLEFGRTMAPSRLLPEYELLDLAQLLRTVIGKQAIATYAKNLRVETHLEPAPCRGNHDQLQTVLDNLISNAVKYSPEGGRLEVSSGADEAGVYVDVRDYGPGFESEEKQQVFDPFFRGSAPVQGHVKGTGLGLAIAHQFVDSHDGRIELLDAEPGARVRVWLPRADSTAPVTETSPA